MTPFLYGSGLKTPQIFSLDLAAIHHWDRVSNLLDYLYSIKFFLFLPSDIVFLKFKFINPVLHGLCGPTRTYLRKEDCRSKVI
jgi:hypothetical protein